ncbi:MAG: VOC family protein [Betaproteobacteria bacterium]|nr:VOC family protein [Betaproteobacteria bacterium]
MEHEKINYVEFPCRDFAAARKFFAAVFGWTFTDYGEEYIAFSNAGLDGGFYRAELSSVYKTGAALIVFYSEDLAATEKKIIENGGKIVQEIFSFPGGRRFHFTEPTGNEFAVWSDK